MSFMKVGIVAAISSLLALTAPAKAGFDNYFCVHLTSDIINIPDCIVTGSLPACHTRLLFDANHAVVEFDSEAAKGAGGFLWDMTHAQFVLPASAPARALVVFTLNASWTAPTANGYAKIWMHVMNTSPPVDQGYGELARDGSLTVANPRINGSIPLLVQQGQIVHLAFEGFNGSGAHAIQAGSSDRPQDTQFRSRLCGYY
jgi:hypothetical protein